MTAYKKCPCCNHDRFYVSPHVVQDWIVDGHGNWLETVEDCTEVIHKPDSDDIWTCVGCKHSASGGEMGGDANG